MAKYLEAAAIVLGEAQEPLTAEEITRRALDSGVLVSQGKTPSQTMKSKLSTDILRRRDRSIFMRADQGLFALRYWKSDLDEYIAPRFKKALLDEQAVVFDVALLETYGIAVGLSEVALENSWDLINSCRPMLRRSAEEDRTVVQLVSGFIVHYRDQYLTYKRSARLPESRLHHTYSVSFGGHLTPRDVPEGQLFNVFTPDIGLFDLEREFAEELRVSQRPKFDYRGLLYDTARPVSRQHLAIVYDVWLAEPHYEVGERGFLLDDRLETLDQIEARLADFENWSEIIVRSERRRHHD